MDDTTGSQPSNEQAENQRSEESLPQSVPAYPYPVVPSPIYAPQQTNNRPSEELIYLSNPFLNAAQGLVKVLSNNPASAMLSSLFIVVAFLIYYLFIVLLAIASRSSPLFVFFGILLLVIAEAIVAPFIIGLYAIIGSASIKNETLSFSETLTGVFKKLPALFAASLMLFIVTYIGLILFIVPGLIFISRCSLSLLIIFQEDLGPIEAIKRSFAMTKGHTFEMMGSFIASYFLSGGFLLITAIGAAPLIGRYNEITQFEKVSAAKPKTHWLNYFLVIGGFLVGVAYIALIIALVIIGITDNHQNLNSPANSTPVSSQAVVQ